MVHWDVYRIPADFRIVLPKEHPAYKTENELLREMLTSFKPPCWARVVIVMADAAFASKANMQLIQRLDRKDPDRSWGFVCAIAKAWIMKDGKSLKNLVRHTPRTCFQRIWVPRLGNEKSRGTFWVFVKRACLRHIGDVTLALSKTGRNAGPQNTKVLATNLSDLSARGVLFVYRRRWPVEILFNELKSGLGLGEHQVTKKLDRIEKSIGIAIIAYLVLIRARKSDIRPGQPWSIFQLKNNFACEVIHDQLIRTIQREVNASRNAA